MSLLKVLQEATEGGSRNPHEAFSTFCKLTACSLSLGQREEEYMAEIKRWKRSTLDVFCKAFAVLIEEMEKAWFTDLLGPIHMEWGSMASHKRGGEFYTPPSINKLLAQMNFSLDSLPKERPVTVLEPCCGSGGMVLAYAEVLANAGVSVQRMQATCIDVNPLAADMCFINMTLWGIPAKVVHGNFLSGETWSEWKNHFWPMAHGDFACGLLSAVTTAQEAVESLSPIETPPAPDIVFPTADKRGQFSFDLEVA